MQTDLAISVRSATARDAPALAELVNQAYAIEAFFVEGDRTNAEEIERMLDRGTFVVLDHTPQHVTPSRRATLVGGVAARPGKAGTCEHACGLAAAVYVERGYFGMLSVLPGLQGHGLGTRLVRIAEAMCESAGCLEVNLRIINLREELARWYRSLGYQEVGTAPYEHRPVKQPCHFVEMRKTLRPVSRSASALGAVAA